MAAYTPPPIRLFQNDGPRLVKPEQPIAPHHEFEQPLLPGESRSRPYLLTPRVRIEQPLTDVPAPLATSWPPDVIPHELIRSAHINSIRDSVRTWPGDVDAQQHGLRRASAVEIYNTGAENYPLSIYNVGKSQFDWVVDANGDMSTNTQRALAGLASVQISAANGFLQFPDGTKQYTAAVDQGGGGEAQTPWLSDIDAANHSLLNIGALRWSDVSLARGIAPTYNKPVVYADPGLGIKVYPSNSIPALSVTQSDTNADVLIVNYLGAIVSKSGFYPQSGFAGTGNTQTGLDQNGVWLGQSKPVKWSATNDALDGSADVSLYRSTTPTYGKPTLYVKPGLGIRVLPSNSTPALSVTQDDSNTDVLAINWSGAIVTKAGFYPQSGFAGTGKTQAGLDTNGLWLGQTKPLQWSANEDALDGSADVFLYRHSAGALKVLQTGGAFGDLYVRNIYAANLPVGGNQTPWTQDIDAAGYQLTNAGLISGPGGVSTTGLVVSVAGGTGVKNASGQWIGCIGGGGSVRMGSAQMVCWSDQVDAVANIDIQMYRSTTPTYGKTTLYVKPGLGIRVLPSNATPALTVTQDDTNKDVFAVNWAGAAVTIAGFYAQTTVGSGTKTGLDGNGLWLASDKTLNWSSNAEAVGGAAATDVKLKRFNPAQLVITDGGGSNYGDLITRYVHADGGYRMGPSYGWNLVIQPDGTFTGPGINTTGPITGQYFITNGGGGNRAFYSYDRAGVNNAWQLTWSSTASAWDANDVWLYRSTTPTYGRPTLYVKPGLGVRVTATGTPAFSVTQDDTNTDVLAINYVGAIVTKAGFYGQTTVGSGTKTGLDVNGMWLAYDRKLKFSNTADAMGPTQIALELYASDASYLFVSDNAGGRRNILAAYYNGTGAQMNGGRIDCGPLYATSMQGNYFVLYPTSGQYGFHVRNAANTAWDWLTTPDGTLETQNARNINGVDTYGGRAVYIRKAEIRPQNSGDWALMILRQDGSQWDWLCGAGNDGHLASWSNRRITHLGGVTFAGDNIGISKWDDNWLIVGNAANWGDRRSLYVRQLNCDGPITVTGGDINTTNWVYAANFVGAGTAGGSWDIPPGVTLQVRGGIVVGYY